MDLKGLNHKENEERRKVKADVEKRKYVKDRKLCSIQWACENRIEMVKVDKGKGCFKECRED